MIRTTISGKLIEAKKGEYTPTEGKNAGKTYPYWRIALLGADGRRFGLSYDLTDGDLIFGSQIGLERFIEKMVIVSIELSNFEGVIKIKGKQIQLQK